MAEQTVTLQPGESKVVSFEVVPTEARTYQVSVNGLTGSFTAAPVGPANIYGQVSNAVTNQPIAGAVVSIFYTAIATTTDQSGYFEFLNLPIGTYVLGVEASGYESFLVNLTVVSGRNGLDIKLDPVAAPPPTKTGIMKLRVRASGGYVESEVTVANLTGQAYRLNIPGADFFYVMAKSSPLGPGFYIFRMNVGDIVPEGISIWHGSVDSWALSDLSGKTCIAYCRFLDVYQNFRGTVSASWQEWEEIPYQPPPEPPGPGGSPPPSEPIIPPFVNI